MSKDISTYSYYAIMGNKALRSQNINSVSSLQASPRYVQFPYYYTLKFIGDSSIANLTYGGSLASIPSVLSVFSSPFCSSSTSITTRVDNQLTNDFVHH